MLAAATCAVTLALGAGACSSSNAAENSDANTSTDMNSGTSQNQTSNQTSVTSESSEDSTVPTELQPRGEEVSTTSADGSVTVTGYATSLSHGDPKIVVTWKSNGDTKNCDLTLT